MAAPVAEPHQLGTWRGEGVGVGEVLSALAELRHAEERTATRTSVVNLVVVATDAGGAAQACDAMHRLGARHPGRSIVLVTGGDDGAGGEARIDAEVVLHGAVAEGHAVWSEDVRLSVQGPLRGHLDSLIEPLTLPDLPVAVWFTGRPPSPADPLLQPADAVLVDSRQPTDEDPLAPIAALDRRHTVVDLSWARLRPWRALLAGLFEVPALRPFLRGVHHVEVEAKPSPRLLLAGWLASRLDLPPSAFSLSDARHARLRLLARHEGREATFVVDRPDGRVVRAAAHVEGGEEHHDRLSLPDDSLTWSLAHALTRLRRDRVHAESLRAALNLASAAPSPASP